jgi:hypothetical protein
VALTDPPPPRNLPARRRDPGAVARDFFSIYLILGIGLGIGSGIFAIKAHKLVEDETTILLTMAGAAVALLAVILTATALMAGLLQGFFGLVIHTAEGLRDFFRPFKITAAVSAAAALVGFGGAMNVDSGPEWLRAALFGLASGLITWAILGTIWLILVFMRYATKQRELLTEEELAKELDEE